jgi:hypothetical protein
MSAPMLQPCASPCCAVPVPPSPADVTEQRASIRSKRAGQAGAARWGAPVVAEAARGAEQAGGAEGRRSVLAWRAHLRNGTRRRRTHM